MWYSASLFFESIHNPPAPKSEHMWEEVVHLIQAGSETEARQKADVIGKKSELNYRVDSGDKVKWRFVKTESVALIEMQELADGAEVYSRFLTAQEAHSLLAPFEK
jgi:hypothetical protein